MAINKVSNDYNNLWLRVRCEDTLARLAVTVNEQKMVTISDAATAMAQFGLAAVKWGLNERPIWMAKALAASTLGLGDQERQDDGPPDNR